jgi:hypothetical protein
MAYFIDGLGTLLFDITIQVLQGTDVLKIIEGKNGEKIRDVLNELSNLNSLYGDKVKYTFTWSWKVESQGYDELVKFIRGPTDTCP